jgi:hypothetical protein
MIILKIVPESIFGDGIFLQADVMQYFLRDVVLRLVYCTQEGLALKSVEYSFGAIHFQSEGLKRVCQKRISPSLRGRRSKQSSLLTMTYGLLRFARNDEMRLLTQPLQNNRISQWNC